MNGVTHFPFSPKMSCKPSCTRSAKLGYFYTTSQQTHTLIEISATCLVQRAVRSDYATLIQVTHLTNNRGNAARTQPCSAPPHELSECTEELALSERRLDGKKVCKDTDDHKQFICRITGTDRATISLAQECSLRAHLSMSDRKAVSNEYGISSL